MAQTSQQHASGAPAAHFSFFLTSDINAQVSLRADRLLGRIPAYEDPDLALGGIVRPSSLYLSAVLCDEHGVLGVASQTHCVDAEEDACSWDSELKFALKYRDLGPTTQIALTIWEVREGMSNPTPLGGTTLRLFSKKGRLKSGSRALRIWLGHPADTSWPSATPSKGPLPGRGRAASITRALKKINRGEFEAVPWLDSLAIKAAQDVLSIEAEANRKTGGAEEELQLFVELLPRFPLSVLYQDAILPVSGAVNPAAAVEDSTGDALSTPMPGTSGSGVTAAGGAAAGAGAGREDALSSLLGRSLANGTGPIVLIHDPEVGKESPAEVKAQKLARSTGRGQVDATLRPNTAERAKIDAVLAQPPGRALSRDEQELLWRFRFALVGEGRALTRFLKCVDWSDALESSQATDLMGRWARITVADALELLSPDYPVEAVRAHAVAALRFTGDEELLHFLLQLVQALRYEPTAESRLASFLVDRARQSAAVASALYWYLCAELEDQSFGGRAAEVQAMLLGRIFIETPVRLSELENDLPGSSSDVPKDCLPLQVNLVARLRHLADAVSTVRSADRKTEALRGLLAPGGVCADLMTFECPCPLDPGVRLLGIVPSGCSVFKSKVSPIKLTFKVELPAASWEESSSSGPGPSAEAGERTGSGGVAAAGGGTAAASAELKETEELPARLASLNLGRVVEGDGFEEVDQGRAGALEARGGGGGGLSSPSGASEGGAGAENVHISRSPQALGAQRRGHSPSSAAASPAAAPRSTPPARAGVVSTTLSLIYKKGDDLRQDQLVLQMISLMDRLLKREHLDLRITAYQVLPTSGNDGLIEFVPASLPLSQVLREHGSIHRFLARRHPDPKGPYGLDPSVLANYVRSCAGSVVVTHVLGIGDRHMDNLMLTTDGRLFHIDFGYVLGRDPKFSTAPLVLNRAMVDGMGGADGPHYKQFVQLCGEAYNILRKSSNLLLSLVHLMAGSSIPDIRSDPEKALLKVQERLMLELDDEAAAEAMEQMLVAAQAAVLPRFAEVQHRVAQGWR